jgi:hypothetical protein
MNSHEISHVAVFLPVGWLIGILGEVIGRRLGHGILALVFDVVVITAIGLGGSDPTERTLSLLGMTAGAGCACLIETGVYAPREQRPEVNP